MSNHSGMQVLQIVQQFPNSREILGRSVEESTCWESVGSKLL